MKKDKGSAGSLMLNKSDFYDFLGHLPLPLLVYQVDPLEIAYYSEAAESLTGFDLKTLQETPFQNLFQENCQDRVEALFLIAQGGNAFAEIRESDLVLYRKNKRKVDLELTARTVSLGGKAHLVISLLDLSELKSLQSERERSIKEILHLSKLADIGQLTAGVAHELNNPLMIIQGFTENLQYLAERGAVPQKDLTVQLAEILKATDRMARLIAKMTRIVRNDDLQMSEVSVQDIVQESLNLLKAEFLGSEVELDLEMDPELHIRCDSVQVEQILINIINNALQALADSQSHRVLKILSFEKDDHTYVRVWNNGPMIPLDVQDRIMSPFFTTKEVGKGTGLGLSVSYGIMKAHEGDLLFVSNETGTYFDLAFPSVKTQSLPLPQEKLKILIVDDDPLAVEGLRGKLERRGHQVISAYNGLEALENLKNHPDMNAVFTDLIMPGMDGRDLMKQIAKIYPHLPYVVTTGYIGTQASEKEVLGLGAHTILHKPIDIKKLTEVLKELERMIPANKKQIA